MRTHMIIILDGWGLSPIREGNSIALANTPYFDLYWNKYPHAYLEAFGSAVGLPEGQMGGSEVGHLNMGAGRTIMQDMSRIDAFIQDDSFYENPALVKAMRFAYESGSRLHLMGLLSHGGVHSSQYHLYALLEMAKRNNLNDVAVHAFLDGRDTAPKSAERFVTEANGFMYRNNVGRIATLSGRYYAMDRDNRWERTRIAFEAIVSGKGIKDSSPLEALKKSYESGINDEFIQPIVIVESDGSPVGTVKNGDCVILFNFRSDRAKQLTRAFTEPQFRKFRRVDSPNVHFVCFKKYDDDIEADIAFSRSEIRNSLAEYLSSKGHTQLHVAETEKFNHVTYFFNGERMRPYFREDRIKIASPAVSTYDERPEMSAREITEALFNKLDENRYSFIVLNYANGDMVGHSGIIEKGVAAVETVDRCMGMVVQRILKDDGVVLLTADHGNCELMTDPETSEPWTAHTLNPVPLIVVDNYFKGSIRQYGLLSDVAPTLLQIMELEQPIEMTGSSLIIGVEKRTPLQKLFRIDDSND